MNGFLMNTSRMVPFAFSRKLGAVNPLIINYHVVSDDRLPHIVNLYKYRSIKGFIEDLDFVCKKYHPISLSEFLDYNSGKARLPKNALLITFDDGLKEIYEIVAPILSDKKITATFFLTTDYLDNQTLGYDHKKSLLIEHLLSTENFNESYHLARLVLNSKNEDRSKLRHEIIYMPYEKRYLIDELGKVLHYNFESFLHNNKPYVTCTQVKEMLSSGFTIGAHGIDHPRFSEITLDHQIRQAKLSVQQITEQFSLPYRVFAFPYSDKKVSLDFFQNISTDIMATFGTNGLFMDQVSNNYQRIGVEKHAYSAKDVIKFYYIKKYIYKLIDKDFIQRSSF